MFWFGKAVLMELGVGYNVCKLELKSKPHLFADL